MKFAQLLYLLGLLFTCLFVGAFIVPISQPALFIGQLFSLCSDGCHQASVFSPFLFIFAGGLCMFGYLYLKVRKPDVQVKPLVTSGRLNRQISTNPYPYLAILIVLIALSYAVILSSMFYSDITRDKSIEQQLKNEDRAKQLVLQEQDVQKLEGGTYSVLPRTEGGSTFVAVIVFGQDESSKPYAIEYIYNPETDSVSIKQRGE